MNPDAIVNKLDVCSECNQIHLDIHKGQPHNKKGGVWTAITKDQLKETLTKVKDKVLDEDKSGWKKHLDKWEKEGKITKEDRQ